MGASAVTDVRHWPAPGTVRDWAGAPLEGAELMHPLNAICEGCTMIIHQDAPDGPWLLGASPEAVQPRPAAARGGMRDEAAELLARLTRFGLEYHELLDLAESKALGAGEEVLRALVRRIPAETG